MSANYSNNIAEGEIAIEREKRIHKTNSFWGLIKAVQIYQYGGTEKLIYETTAVPKPAPDEVPIRVHAAGINPVDWKIREGFVKDTMPHQLPLILGWDVAGTIVHTGILITRFNEGNKVFPRPDMMRHGSYAEYVTVKALAKVKKAHELSQSGKARGKIILRVYNEPNEQ